MTNSLFCGKMNAKKPEEHEFQPEMSNSSLNSQKMLFTECDENELVRVNVEVEEIHRQKLLRESSPYDCPPVSHTDCSSLTSSAPSTLMMNGTDGFDIDAAYQQIVSGGCYIRLKRCDGDNYSPPLKKSKFNCESPENAAASVVYQIDQSECITPLFRSSPCTSDDDGPSMNYQCTSFGSNGIKLVRKEVSHSALFDKLKNLYRNTISLSPSEDQFESEDKLAESERKVVKKQTSRKSTYRPSSEIDQKKKETLDRVKFKTEKKSKRRHSSPDKSRKKSLKHKIQEKYRSHRNIHSPLKLFAETYSSSDEDRFDIKPRYEIPPAPPAVATKISSVSVSPPRTNPPLQRASSSPVESKADLQHIPKSCIADMPSLDEFGNDYIEEKKIIFKSETEESENLTLPVTINTNARPSMLTSGECKIAVDRPLENINFPNFGPSITVSLIPPPDKKTEVVLAKIKNESIDFTEDNTLCKKPKVEPDKSKIGLIKVRSPNDLGISNPLTSFAMGMSKLCHLPSHLISLSGLKTNIASTQISTTSSSTVTTSTVPIIVDKPSDKSSTCTDIPRDPRLAHELSAPISSPSTQPSAIQSPVAKTNLAFRTSISRPVPETTTENNATQSSVAQSAVAQTNSTSPTSNGPSAPKPRAKNTATEEMIQNRKMKIEEELRRLSARLYHILKEYLKKNLSQKKKSNFKAENFDAFRGLVSRFLRSVSVYAGPNENHFHKHVQHNFLKLLRYAAPDRVLNPDEAAIFLQLMGHESMECWYNRSLIFEVLGERDKEIAQTQKQSNLGNVGVPNSQSTSSILSQPVLNANNNRPNGDQLLNQSGSDLKTQQNRYNGQPSANSQKTALQLAKNNPQPPSLIQQQHIQCQPQSITTPITNFFQSKPSPPQNISRAADVSVLPSQIRLPPSNSFAATQSRPSPPSISPSNLHQNNNISHRIEANMYPSSSFQLPQQQVIESMRMQHINNQHISAVQNPSTYQQGATVSSGVLASGMSYPPSTVVPLGLHSSPTAGYTYQRQNGSALQLTTYAAYSSTMTESIEYTNNSNHQIYPLQVNVATQQPPYQEPFHFQPQVQYQSQLQYPQQGQYLQQLQYLQQSQYPQQYQQQSQVIQQPIQLQSHLLQQQRAAENRVVPSVTAPVSVPLVNSSQSPSPSYNALDSTEMTVTNQPVSVNLVQSTSRTTPERTSSKPNSRSSIEVDKADYDMYKKCTEMLKEFYKVTSSQF